MWQRIGIPFLWTDEVTLSVGGADKVTQRHGCCPCHPGTDTSAIFEKKKVARVPFLLIELQTVLFLQKLYVFSCGRNTNQHFFCYDPQILQSKLSQHLPPLLLHYRVIMSSAINVFDSTRKMLKSANKCKKKSCKEILEFTSIIEVHNSVYKRQTFPMKIETCQYLVHTNQNITS